MSSKWKFVTGKIHDIYVYELEKINRKNSSIFYVHEVVKCNWRILRYFISTNYKSLTVKVYNITVHEEESFNYRTLQYFMSTKWKSVGRQLHE